MAFSASPIIGVDRNESFKLDFPERSEIFPFSASADKRKSFQLRMKKKYMETNSIFADFQAYRCLFKLPNLQSDTVQRIRFHLRENTHFEVLNGNKLWRIAKGLRIIMNGCIAVRMENAPFQKRII